MTESGCLSVVGVCLPCESLNHFFMYACMLEIMTCAMYNFKFSNSQYPGTTTNLVVALFHFTLPYHDVCLSFQSTELRNNAIAPRPKVRLETFRWQSSYEKSNATKITTCRNSVQGKNLITDDHGEKVQRSAC